VGDNFLDRDQGKAGSDLVCLKEGQICRYVLIARDGSSGISSPSIDRRYLLLISRLFHPAAIGDFEWSVGCGSVTFSQAWLNATEE